ncbi:MAG: ATP-dependent Clp protease ATP-binding subunit ClpX [Firmicutes bacterium]|nr:ATP-dependent Clp protease ATP-binding subunit ClpX [Bacillota bacterium]
MIKKLPTPAEIRAHLDEYVIGQDDAKRVLSVSIYNHYKRIMHTDTDVEITKSNVLMIGPTGVGKTYIVQTLARMLDVPFAMSDATTLVGADSVSEEIQNIILKLYQNSNYDIKQAELGMVYIDEVDKLASKFNRGGEAIQQALLKTIEGSIATINTPNGPVDIDTKNILFVGGGAFVGLNILVKSRLTGSTIVLDENESNQLIKDAAVSDFAKFGLIPEFIGRLQVIVTLNALDKQALVDILTKPKNALVTQYKKLFAMDGVELVFDEESLLKIAEKASALKTGARGLRTVLERHLRDIMYDSPSAKNLNKVTINADFINKEGEATFDYVEAKPEDELQPIAPRIARSIIADNN